MRLTSPADIKVLLQQAGVTPSKTLGQNFLFDANVRDAIVTLAGVDGTDTVLEIGPGLGVLTEALLERGRKVVAIEMDAKLHAHLGRFFGPLPHLELIRADALDVDLKGLLDGGVTRVVSNLPYSAGSRILFELTGPGPRPLSITAMVQSDVAHRISAGPGDEAYGLLGIWLQMFFEVTGSRLVKPTVFYPAPRVDSAVLHLARRAAPQVELPDWTLFIAMLKHAFSRRRKQMGGIFRDAPPRLTCTPAVLEEVLIEDPPAARRPSRSRHGDDSRHASPPGERTGRGESPRILRSPGRRSALASARDSVLAEMRSGRPATVQRIPQTPGLEGPSRRWDERARTCRSRARFYSCPEWCGRHHSRWPTPPCARHPPAPFPPGARRWQSHGQLRPAYLRACVPF
ncbi:MAG: 16S rRNA (adenine(1518)-N(6)/adenine(1519)-N(6))-dimethyltransferase RsmA [Kiritimatiellia bacterium]